MNRETLLAKIADLIQMYEDETEVVIGAYITFSDSKHPESDEHLVSEYDGRSFQQKDYIKITVSNNERRNLSEND